MTREQLIQAVKVKLEEISPFEEPKDFIAADNDSDYDKVKPIVSYIEDNLDKATWKCLCDLPTTILTADIERMVTNASIDEKGVGHIPLSEDSPYTRFVRVEAPTWRRACTTIISSNDALSLLQDNPFTRGGSCKPAVVFNTDENELQLYSVNNYEHVCPRLANGHVDPVISCKVWMINTEKNAEYVLSNISDFIALQCAALVYEILGRTDNTQLMLQEYDTKKQLLLK